MVKNRIKIIQVLDKTAKNQFLIQKIKMIILSRIGRKS